MAHPAHNASDHAGPAATAGSAGCHDPRKAGYEANKLRKRLRRQVGEAIGAYGLIAPHDRVMVCVSGGKDSYGLLDLLTTLRERAPLDFEIVAVNLDQKQPGFPGHVLPDGLGGMGSAHEMRPTMPRPASYVARWAATSPIRSIVCGSYGAGIRTMTVSKPRSR